MAADKEAIRGIFMRAAFKTMSPDHYLSGKYDMVKDRGVKQAPFYVLIGTQMPSILIGTSYISNDRECKRLNSEKYQKDLCEGILKGIEKYINAENAMSE